MCIAVAESPKEEALWKIYAEKCTVVLQGHDENDYSKAGSKARVTKCKTSDMVARANRLTYVQRRKH